MKQRCIIQNGRLFYERLQFPRFAVEIIPDGEGYMFNRSTLLYADEKKFSKLLLDSVMFEASCFIMSFLITHPFPKKEGNIVKTEDSISVK